MQLFSQNISTLREKHRRSKAELARQFGVSFSSYKRWEEGTEPSLEKLVEISDYFGVAIDVLLRKDLSQPANVEHLTTAADDRALASQMADLQQTVSQLQAKIKAMEEKG